MDTYQRRVAEHCFNIVKLNLLRLVPLQDHFGKRLWPPAFLGCDRGKTT